MIRRSFRHIVTALVLLVAFVCQGTWALAGTTGGLSGSVVDADNCGTDRRCASDGLKSVAKRYRNDRCHRSLYVSDLTAGHVYRDRRQERLSIDKRPRSSRFRRHGTNVTVRLPRRSRPSRTFLLPAWDRW